MRIAPALACVLLVACPARAASLTGPVTGWAKGVPGYISMYEYVPAKPASNPPILVVSHYCGGNAAGVFGEAQGGGIVAASEKYGFIMIFPQTSNNCWDVGSMKSLTHDGGGDTQAIAEMVTYAIAEHGADADRVYLVGTSSGAMMTQALLAIYPDVFKAGAEFSGVPAGCWAASYSASNQWSGPCAGGQVTHTAQEWGDMVRAMYKGYSGYRPRVQLWHGMADSTIRFPNQTEAIKEWTNVLGLDANPTSNATVNFMGHQWTHESWQDSCGFTVLDAWSEQNGPHGTDANLNATNVVPFLGLDKAGLVDPQVAQCGRGGAGANGTGGAGGAGGTGGSAGSGAAGTSGNGGAISSGGWSAAGGLSSTPFGSGGTKEANGGNVGTGAAAVAGFTGSGGTASGGWGGGIMTAPGPANGGVAAPTAAGESSAAGVGAPASGCTCTLADVSKGRGSLPAMVALVLVPSTLARRRRTRRPQKPPFP